MDDTEFEFIACAGKHKFPSADEASAAVRRQRRGDNRIRLGIYRCEFCGHFHIGKGRKRKLRSKR